MMINSFKQYIVEEAKTLYFTFGRMNPPTIGHEKLLEVLSSKSGNNPYRIYLSQTNDKKKNPLLYNDKVKYARKMMPKHARYIMLNKDVKTIFDAANAIYNEGFVNVVMVVGSDRITEFKSLLTKYNGKTGQRYGFYNFRTIDVISAGERDPDSEGVDGMSASKMRAAAGDNDFNQFTKGLPKNFSNKDSKDLFNGVRSGMGLKEETEFYKHVQLESVGDLREKYIQGEIYNLGERLLIKDTDELAEVTFRGPNYLILEKEDGSIVRKWIEAVESLDEAVKKVAESIESVNEDPTQLAHDAVTSAEMLKGLGILGTGAVIKYGITDPLTKVIHKKITNTVDKFKADRKRKKPPFVEPIARTINNENKELDNYNKTGWGTKESTKKWVDATPGQVMPDVKPTPKSKTRTRKHPGSDVSDAGGMGEGAVKRGLLPSQDKFGPGMSKADYSNAKVSPTSYQKKPDDLVTKIKIARKGAKLILGDKQDGK